MPERHSGQIQQHEAAQAEPGRPWPLLAVGATGAAVALGVQQLAQGRVFTGGSLMTAAVLCAAGSVLLQRRTAACASDQSAQQAPEILESLGPMVLVVDLKGRIVYVNPAAERLTGYFAHEILAMPAADALLPPGQSERVVRDLIRLCLGEERASQTMTRDERLAVYVECLRSLPPSKIPSIENMFLRKDGTTVPVLQHLSALRDSHGQLCGLIAISMDRSGNLRQEQALRESQERYRDLFENSTEMIATLSPSGQFLYANPAWKRWVGLSRAELQALPAFEQAFAPNCREQVSELFRRALGGEPVERVPLRMHRADGRVQELELSLSQRQKAGNPLAVRCLMRDVTQQRQRECRLALQLSVSQIVAENAAPETAVGRVLEALCSTHGWDVAIKWELRTDENRLEFAAAWGEPGRLSEAVIQHSTGQHLESGESLAGEAWREGRIRWQADLSARPDDARARMALEHGMVSGWAVPVRVGRNILGVLEGYTHFRLCEDAELLASVETVAATLGQLVDRQRQHGRAEELSRQQEILLDAVADAICGLDRAGRVTLTNPAAVQLLGSSAESLAGLPLHELLHGVGEQALNCGSDCLLRSLAQARVPMSGEITVARADGSSFPAEYGLTPIFEQGRYAGSVLNFRDISQRSAMDRVKDEFISTVSHELRTPLTSIRGALGLLSSGILGQINDKAANLLRIALTNSDRLVRLINDILDLERIQSGREPLSFRPVQLGEVVRQAIDGIHPMADAARVLLLHDSTQVEVSADPDRLMQVVTNLLSNAVKFSPVDGAVTVTLQPGVSGVTISVIDQGRGIPADKLEAIFGRFQQVDASDARQKGGTGLGLAICRSIVVQHSGRIWAERNADKGSTFRVFLPYQPSVAIAPGDCDTSLSNGSILLADANPVSRAAVASQLARHGYRVVETESPEQTLAAARAGVEAILLDASAEGINGWELLPRLREIHPEASTPIVLLSLAGEGATVQATLADGQVAQPATEEALLRELARVLSTPGEKARVLIVEDDEDLARMIGSIFAGDSIEVELALTRQQALDACFAFHPNLLVLDIGLPDGDGFHLVAWLRQHEELASLPLVVYSGRDLNAAERRQLTLGPTHFLNKACVQPQQLEALVRHLLRSSRRADQALLPVADDPA